MCFQDFKCTVDSIQGVPETVLQDHWGGAGVEEKHSTAGLRFLYRNNHPWNYSKWPGRLYLYPSKHIRKGQNHRQGDRMHRQIGVGFGTKEIILPQCTPTREKSARVGGKKTVKNLFLYGQVTGRPRHRSRLSPRLLPIYSKPSGRNLLWDGIQE